MNDKYTENETTPHEGDKNKGNIKGNIIEQFIIKNKPSYIRTGNEEKVFRAAYTSNLPVILKGPTGCGKTRFVEYMSYQLEAPLVTVSCHEDLTAADLVGRYVFKDNETVWQDGPLALESCRMSTGTPAVNVFGWCLC